MTLNNEVTYNVDLNQVIIATPGPQGPPGATASTALYSSSAGLVTSASGIPTRWYGSFYDTSQQTLTSANTGVGMKCNNSDSASTSGVRMNSSSILFDYAGIYNIQFSAQLYESSNNVSIDIWLRKNGSNIPWSNTRLSPSSQNPYLVAAWNFVVDAAKNDWYQIMWASTDVSTVLDNTASNAYHPATPSVILTAVQI